MAPARLGAVPRGPARLTEETARRASESLRDDRREPRREGVMAEPQLVLWTESDNGPRFGIDTDGIAAAGGAFRSVRCRDEAERIAAARDARVMVVSAAAITDAVYAGAARLVGIVRTGIGLDTVDIPAATRHGVCISHVPDFCYDEVADTAWALILAVTRKVVLADRHVRAGEWAPGAVMPVHTLRGQTLGLVAFGHIARKVAEREIGRAHV